MNDYKIDIKYALYGYYIRYDKLKSMMDQELINYNYDTVEVYIDLYDMLLPLYRSDMRADKQFTIVSSVINLAAHVREFYLTRYNLNTIIYLVYADGTNCNHRQFYHGFGDTDLELMMNYDNTRSIIEDQLKLIQILSAYIYGVYYIRRTCDFTVFTYNCIHNNINCNYYLKEIILTKSLYAYQIPALFRNACIIRPKKYKGEDYSFIVNKKNSLFLFYNKVGRQKSLDKMKEIDSSLLSLLITLTSLPSKKVTVLFNTTTAINKIYDLVKQNKIISHTSDIKYIYYNMNIADKIDESNFCFRFDAIDVVFQNMIYMNTAESKDTSHIINLNDKNAIQNINDKYFIDNPLNLNCL